MIASVSDIGAKLSSTAVRMCASRKATASSDTLRCSESNTNRGQRALLQRLTPATPNATLRVSRISDTAPVDRVRYQYVLGPTEASETVMPQPPGAGLETRRA